MSHTITNVRVDIDARDTIYVTPSLSKDVRISVGGAVHFYFSDTAALDALHEAVTRAYELIAEPVA